MCNYKDLEIPPNSIVYADPPYSGTTKYSTSKDFNHDEFWNWCREKYRDGHKIFISEYQAPEDFVCIWSKEMYSSLDIKGGKRNMERLFVPAAQLEQEKKSC
jgi:DNA adenine methylase